MRALALLLPLAACGSRPAAPPPPRPVTSVDAFVVDAHGPVAGLDVRLVALPDGRCPCAAPAETSGYGNEMPECACPEALTAWRKRLASCVWPASAVQALTTDERGHATLPRPRGATGIEVARGDGVRWLPWPKTSGPISLELAAAISPRVTIQGDREAAAQGAQLRGAFLFDDGHCIPLERRDGAWGPSVPLPRFEVSGGTLVVETPGYATIVYSLFDQDEIELELRRALPIEETCEDGATTARLDNPFQHLVTKVGKDKRFSFEGVIAMASTITCWEDADTSNAEWDYDPEYGLQEGGYVNTYSSGSCEQVRVLDEQGRPVANAEVMAMQDHGGGMSTGTGGTTDASGVACVEGIYRGTELVVTAPGDRGGTCGGEARVQLTQQLLAKPPLVVRLRMAKLAMATPRGRIVNPEGTPVAGAVVMVGDVMPSGPDQCTGNADASVTTGVDGSFTLPAHPRGKLTISVHHDWYAEHEVTLANDGTPHDIVLSRGGTWTGRVLDPDGKVLDHCTLFLTLESGRILTAACSATGFSLSPLTSGEAKVKVRLEHHALGAFRTLAKKLHIDASKPLTLDLAFPRGEDITGRVVDSKGNAVAGARLTALPKGTPDAPDRFDEDEVMLEADAYGRFTFRHLKPGIWRIRGDRRSGRQTTFEVTTGATNVELVIPDPR